LHCLSRCACQMAADGVVPIAWLIGTC
jgi:hypothetical protein